MEADQRAQGRGSVPRLSRLPMPRASTDNLKKLRPVASRDTLTQMSLQTPSSTRTGVSNTHRTSIQRPPLPLGEGSHNSIKGQSSWSDRLSRNQNKSPVREALLHSSVALLETTPPNSASEIQASEDIGENAFAEAALADSTHPPGNGLANDKRRPRPSLSERTIETLSQISPSPSPSRRRSSIFSVESVMGPPSQPASSMRTPRRNTANGPRSVSPTKPPFRPAGTTLPRKNVAPVSSSLTTDSIYTPPRAFVRDNTSRIVKPLRETRRSVSTTATESSHAVSHEKTRPQRSAQTVRIKTASNLNQTKSSYLEPSVHLTPQRTLGSTSKQDSSTSEQPLRKSGSGVTRPRSRDENALASSTAATSSDSSFTRGSRRLRGSPNTEARKSRTPPQAQKSSPSLRATIAEAKAQAKKARGQTQDGFVTMQQGKQVDGSEEQQVSISGNNSGLLRKRVQAATTSGILNISAMALRQIPEEVMHMYDFDPSSTANWSETVDLVKLVAADNQFADLGEYAFPDWSLSEMEQDDSKSNQFGGLETLDFHGNLLQSLPLGLRRLERLQILNLNNNRLRMDAMGIICQLRSLRELYIACNDLSGDVPSTIENLGCLRILDLCSNAIEKLPDTTGSLKELQILRISKNKISQLPFEVLAALPLTELIASKNRLRGCLFPKGSALLQRLKHLDVSFNDLDTVSFDRSFPAPSLQSLAVDGNHLSNLPAFPSPGSLWTLTASENLLDKLPDGFTLLSNLKNADLSCNQIRAVPLEIALMQNLTSLNLASNPLRERMYLNYTTAQLKDDLLKRLGQDELSATGAQRVVQNVNADESALTDSPSKAAVPAQECRYVPKSGVLDLSTLDSTSLDDSKIDLTSPVINLKLSSTSLSCLPVSLLQHPSIQSHIQVLDISHNSLSATNYLNEALTLPKLTSLCIVSTGLASLTPLVTHLSAPNLHTLNISCHRLTGALPRLREHFPKLTTLLATDNWFTSVSVDAVRGLEVLDIRNNEIDSLPSHIGMLGNKDGQRLGGRLRSLEVSGNKFRVPTWRVIERGTEAILKDLRRMVPLEELNDDWREDL